MNANLSGLGRIAGAALLLLAAGAAQADESQTAPAFAVVTTDGDMIPSGDGGFRIVGTVSGPFFIESEHGPIDSGELTCLADVDGQTNRVMQGSGSCVLTAHDGAQLFGDWTCEGVHFVGCQGEFVVNGGNGRLEGVTGGGAMTMRTSETLLSDGDLMSMAKSQGRGIVFWDAFSFVPPAAN